jgi:hypothetical protein
MKQLRLHYKAQPVNAVWGNSRCLLGEAYGQKKINFQIIYKNSVRTSQETRYISSTKANRLMLLGESVSVYCENHTEHINTLRGQNAEYLYQC